MITEWKKLDAIHYDKTNKEWIINKNKSIINTSCFLENKRLYTIKVAYHIDSNGDIKHQIYDRVHSKYTNETLITLYKGVYPNIEIYKMDSNGELMRMVDSFNREVVGKQDTAAVKLLNTTIINMHKFNQTYNSDFYKGDIETLKQGLDKHDIALLEIKLKKIEEA